MQEENKAKLYIFSGLPASGKSTLAQGISQKLGAVYLRIDTIEQGLRDLYAVDLGAQGYQLSYRVAADNLALGNDVVADSCNPIRQSRDEWEAVAVSLGLQFVNIQVICSDIDEHRSRTETRFSNIQGLILPSWQDVMSRTYDSWHRERIVIDTAGRTPVECLDELTARIVQR